ncbi:MAG: hypothetical protein LUC83_05720 [Clostridiales bacterium]|nr:hypothetical protein [Clostridiales bacterium]
MNRESEAKTGFDAELKEENGKTGAGFDMALKEKSRGGGMTGDRLGIVLKSAGVFLMIFVIAICLPLTVPRAVGWEIYAAIDFNYGPEVAEGSLIYVEQYVGADLVAGDMVTYYSSEGGGVALRLVGENRYEEEELYVTDGWGNGETVSYAQVLGHVVIIIPFLGRILSMVATRVGAACLGGIFLLGLVLILLEERRENAAGSGKNVRG